MKSCKRNTKTNYYGIHGHLNKDRCTIDLNMTKAYNQEENYNVTFVWPFPDTQKFHIREHVHTPNNTFTISKFTWNGHVMDELPHDLNDVERVIVAIPREGKSLEMAVMIVMNTLVNECKTSFVLYFKRSSKGKWTAYALKEPRHLFNWNRFFLDIIAVPDAEIESLPYKNLYRVDKDISTEELLCLVLEEQVSIWTQITNWIAETSRQLSVWINAMLLIGPAVFYCT
ncbi:hypothetical protein BEWA_031420 [Theileria equi strain WA]|uniref:Uncharacterized protein n=1 Tax=Theileria equi strain WA TaxID=1537102 RepID=L0AZG0_THEEQ|nr:hypothetical protein BEWA_031420 [Theileria equi strain WA]AFZ80289.1 hypothetical protein BEWA_031420 [Theileria equi strain WA]|eukprot:XP_004829955.1 hypothetical protein BEWA_031420 [Theileria equi strain WA]